MKFAKNDQNSWKSLKIMKFHDFSTENQTSPIRPRGVQDHSGHAYGPGIDRYGRLRPPTGPPGSHGLQGSFILSHKIMQFHDFQGFLEFDCWYAPRQSPHSGYPATSTARCRPRGWPEVVVAIDSGPARMP